MNNKFTIDVVFLANKINNEYNTYVYPKLLIKIKTDKKEKKVNLTNENVDFKKNQFHSRDGEIFSVESVKNEIIISLQNILGIFENYLKVSNDIFDLEKKLNPGYNKIWKSYLSINQNQ